MDGENNGKPYFLMDDLGGKNPYFWKLPVREVETISPWKMSFFFVKGLFFHFHVGKGVQYPKNKILQYTAPKVNRQFAPESHEGWEMP